jgi:hypothetical protein
VVQPSCEKDVISHLYVQGGFDGFVSIGQRIVAICNIIISTAMSTMPVAYTRSTGSCVVMEKSISTCVCVLYPEKSISAICAVIEKTISSHTLVC